MRPWLFLPIVVPGIWFAMTWAKVWPTATPEWVMTPPTGLGIAAGSLMIAFLAERTLNSKRRDNVLAREERAVLKRLEAERAANGPGPNDGPRTMAEDDAIEKGLLVADLRSGGLSGLRVEMPERR